MDIPYDTYNHHKTHIKPDAKFLFISADVSMSSKWPEFLANLADTYDVV